MRIVFKSKGMDEMIQEKRQISEGSSLSLRDPRTYKSGGRGRLKSRGWGGTGSENGLNQENIVFGSQERSVFQERGS